MECIILMQDSVVSSVILCIIRKGKRGRNVLYSAYCIYIYCS